MLDLFSFGIPNMTFGELMTLMKRAQWKKKKFIFKEFSLHDVQKKVFKLNIFSYLFNRYLI